MKLSSLSCQSKVSEFVLTSKLSHIGLKLGAFQNNEGERAKTCLKAAKKWQRILSGTKISRAALGLAVVL